MSMLGIEGLVISRFPTSYRLLHWQPRSASPLRAPETSSSYSSQSCLFLPCFLLFRAPFSSLDVWCSSRRLGVRASSRGSKPRRMETINHCLTSGSLLLGVREIFSPMAHVGKDIVHTLVPLRQSATSRISTPACSASSSLDSLLDIGATQHALSSVVSGRCQIVLYGKLCLHFLAHSFTHADRVYLQPPPYSMDDPTFNLDSNGAVPAIRALTTISHILGYIPHLLQLPPPGCYQRRIRSTNFSVETSSPPHRISCPYAVSSTSNCSYPSSPHRPTLPLSSIHPSLPSPPIIAFSS